MLLLFKDCRASILAALVALSAACSDHGPGNASTIASLSDSHTTFPSSDPTTVPGTSEPIEPTTSGDDTGPDSQSDTSAPTTGGATGDPTTGGPNENDAALCQHLGGFSGIGKLIEGFLATVLVDERINAYFLTTDVDGARLAKCLQAQLGAATGCEAVIYDCEDMVSAHAGMGISEADFTDLAADFSAAMDAHQEAHPKLTDDDKATILGVLGSMAPDIVEDVNNDVTTYQRVGRKPGIAAVIGNGNDPQALLGRVATDPTIVGFFTKTDFLRLQTCLVRQVTSAGGGPQIYGKEVDAPSPADPGVGAGEPCRDMVAAHKSLKDVNDGTGIEFADFVALVTHLLEAMDSFGVQPEDQNTIVGALGPLCPEIVTVDPESCP